MSSEMETVHMLAANICSPPLIVLAQAPASAHTPQHGRGSFLNFDDFDIELHNIREDHYSIDVKIGEPYLSNTHRKLSSQNELALSIEMLRKIWKPDTFVYNGKKSYLHTITTPNRFVRWDTVAISASKRSIRRFVIY